MHTIGIDVGGSSVKAAVVDTAAGHVVGDRLKVASTDGFHREDMVALIAEIAGRLGDHPVGIGFPGVVVDGVCRTNPTSHEIAGWQGADLVAEIGAHLGRPVRVANDADVAGIAEQRFGAAAGVAGTVIVLTFGTGIGSAVLSDGHLVPNVELGRIYLQGHAEVVEEHAAARIRTEQGLDWPTFGDRIQDLLAHLERIMSPALFVLGGGVSDHAEEYVDRLDLVAPVVPARLRSRAGIIGAGVLATT